MSKELLIKKAMDDWNAASDIHNQWDDLGLDEKLDLFADAALARSVEPDLTDAQLVQYLRDRACGGSNFNRVLNHAAAVLEGANPAQAVQPARTDAQLRQMSDQHQREAYAEWASPEPVQPPVDYQHALRARLDEYLFWCNLHDSEQDIFLAMASGTYNAMQAQPVPPTPATHETPHYLSIERSHGVPVFGNGPVAVLYSDSINGCMVRRDDVWLALTSQIAQPVQPTPPLCKKCAGPMRPSQAIAQTFSSGAPDFPGDRHSITMSPGGPGRLIKCLKCKGCGYSVIG